MQRALINDQFALEEANNLFASVKGHTRRPLNSRQHPEEKQCRDKNSRTDQKSPDARSDDASGKHPPKAKVLVVHRIGFIGTHGLAVAVAVAVAVGVGV